MTAGPDCTITKLAYGNPETVVDFENDAAGMPNSEIGTGSRIYGEYLPFGPGKAWVIKLNIKGAEYTAVLNGEGGWHVEVPADVYIADSNESVTVAVATCNGQNAYFGSGVTVATGQLVE